MLNLIVAFFNQIHSDFAWYSNVQLAGIPGDWIAHFFFGFCLYFVVIHSGYSAKTALFVLLGLTLAKEFVDSFALTYTLTNSVVDCFFSFLGPLLIYSARLSLPMPIRISYRKHYHRRRRRSGSRSLRS